VNGTGLALAADQAAIVVAFFDAIFCYKNILAASLS
jgi:hypothetical protein